MATRVLIVAGREQRAYAAALKHQLGVAGCGVALVESAEDCFRSATAKPPDVILVSAELVPVSGPSLCNALKGDPQLKEIPLVLLSSEPVASLDSHRRLPTRADEYVQKSEDFRPLFEKLHTLLAARKRQASERAASSAPAPESKPAESAPAQASGRGASLFRGAQRSPQPLSVEPAAPAAVADRAAPTPPSARGRPMIELELDAPGAIPAAPQTAEGVGRRGRRTQKLQAELAKLDRERAELTERLAELTERHAALVEEHTELAGKHEELERERTRARAAHDEIARQLEQREATWAASLLRAREEQAVAVEQAERARRKCIELEAARPASEGVEREHAAELAKLEQAHARELAERDAAAAAEAQRLEQALERATAELEQARAAQADAARGREDVVAEREERAQQLDALERERGRLLDQLGRLQTELAEARAKASEDLAALERARSDEREAHEQELSERDAAHANELVELDAAFAADKAELKRALERERAERQSGEHPADPATGSRAVS